MHWRITVEAMDPIGDGYSKEFLVEKSLDDLTEGRLGCSIEDGKTIMAQIQKAVVERELDLWVRFRRACQTCGGRLPIKVYQKRKILTVFGAVPVTFPRLLVCQKCSPWSSSTLSPAAEICADRATPELLEISASLGARMSYREASDILSTFLPCHLSRKFLAEPDRHITTLAQSLVVIRPVRDPVLCLRKPTPPRRIEFERHPSIPQSIRRTSYASETICATRSA